MTWYPPVTARMRACPFVRASGLVRARPFALTLALALAPVALALSGCATSDTRSLAPASSGDQMRLAQLRYDRREYTEAIELLKGYIQYQPGASDVGAAHHLLGMCYVARREWPLATGEFLIVTSDFTDSPQLGDSHYWLGYSYWKQARPAPYDQDFTRRSISQWDRFLALFPDHPRAAEARDYRAQGRARLAEKSVKNGELYLKLKQWSPAAVYFLEVERDFPDTPWIDRAQVGHAESLRQQGKFDEARRLLEPALDGMADPDQRRRAEVLLRMLPPSNVP